MGGANPGLGIDNVHTEPDDDSMAKGRYQPYLDQKSGLRFDFKFELMQPSLLHIFVRHGTSPQEAIGTFFEGETAWDEEHKRFETFTETHALYWTWRAQGAVVLVISCFRRDE